MRAKPGQTAMQWVGALSGQHQEGMADFHLLFSRILFLFFL
jgi:hypothetical protein